MKNSSRGFTVIELVVAIVIVCAAVVLFWIQRDNFQSAASDDQRKTAINALYYSLEEVYYPQQSYYPTKITSETLPSVDPNLLRDPNGITIGEGESDYRYEPTNCSNDRCRNYTLRANLENEADFIRESNR